MENVLGRVRNTLNLIVLMAVLLAQVIGLAIQVQVQVKGRSETGSTRLIRVWAISIVTPITRGIIHSEDWFSNSWHDYVWLRGVRKENEDLKDQIAQMRMQQVRMIEDATQAHRLQLLLGFKEQYISQTVPAQVISTTGSEFSRAIYIDKGTKDGITADMPVVAPEGIVGKVLRAFHSTSLVLLISDPTSGAGVILESSRLQGVLKGTANGATMMQNVMSDEKVQPGERILTSGGDRIFPKGLPVGTVTAVNPGADLFLNIRVRPAVTLNKLEEVLVITKIEERAAEGVASAEGPKRAIDILAQRLPTVAPPKPENSGTTEVGKLTTSVNSGTGRPVPEMAKTPAAATSSATNAKPKSPDLGGSPTPKKNLADTVEKPKPVKQAQTTPAVKPPDAAKETQPQ